VILAIAAALALVSFAGWLRGAEPIPDPRSPIPSLDAVAKPRVHTSGKVKYFVSPLSGAAVCTIEWLDKATIAGNAVRKDNWRMDPNLPIELRLSPSLYANSGFDKGHLPGADGYGRQADRDATFLSSLCVPQVPSVNRGVIAQIESFCYEVARENDGALIATLAIFQPGKHKLVGNTFPVPDQIGKAALVYGRGKPQYTVAWLVPNKASSLQPPASSLRTSVDRLEDLSQIELFDEQLADDVEARLESNSSSEPLVPSP
jgi:DNA/RNA endonuclease G (NUC1)